MKISLNSIASLALFTMLSLTFANAPMMQNAVISTHPDRGDVMSVEGVEAALIRTDSGITLNFFTNDLIAGNAYSAWWVIVNEPENCETRPCTAADIIVNVDGTKSNLTSAGGMVANEHGIANFFSHLALGEVPNPWYSHDFIDPYGVEVHIVLHEHGPVIEGMEEEMTSTYRAGCTDESLPAIFPVTALTDGASGPNDCQHFQFAIFMP